MRWYLKALNQYADFRGRASREEFVYFVIFNLLFTISAVVIDSLLDLEFGRMPFGYFTVSYILATAVPSYALQTRRLHDTGRDGWYVFVPGFHVWSAGEVGENQFGPDPLEAERIRKIVS